jgi:hypothetical protein
MAHGFRTVAGFGDYWCFLTFFCEKNKVMVVALSTVETFSLKGLLNLGPGLNHEAPPLGETAAFP